MLTNFVQGHTLDLLFVCTKFYCCDCCEVFNVHLTFSANLEAESVSKQVKTSHADFLMACVMIVHADRTRDHINYRVTKRDAWQTALEGQRRLISIALFFICKKLCSRIETIKEIRKKFPVHVILTKWRHKSLKLSSNLSSLTGCSQSSMRTWPGLYKSWIRIRSGAMNCLISLFSCCCSARLLSHTNERRRPSSLWFVYRHLWGKPGSWLYLLYFTR